MGNDALARGRVLAVVNQFGRGVSIGDRLQCPNLFFVVVIEVFKPRRIRKQIRLLLMQLYIRHEPRVTDIIGKRLF